MQNRSCQSAIFLGVRVWSVTITGALVALVLGCLSTTAQATGLEPGVHADPGSPAAKEYALPINQARQTGSGGTGHAKSGSAALFGSGIKPPGSRGSKAARSNSGGSTQRGARPGAPAASDAGGPAPVIVLHAARSQASPSGDGSILALVGGGVAILVLGAFGGTLMRRSRRSLPAA